MNLSVKDAATLLQVSEKTIYRWIKKDVIPAYRIHGQHRFNRSELLEWATSRRMGLAPEAFDEAETATQELPTLTESLQGGGIIYRLEGKTREEVLSCLVDNLRLPDAVDRGYLLQTLLARERLASTSVGDGIAIPHPRNPILQPAEKPFVTLAFLEDEVDFHALDGKPVNILFCLMAPSLRVHLHLLSMLGFALHDRNFLTCLAQTEGREKIFSSLLEVKREMGRPKVAQLTEQLIATGSRR